MSVCLYVRFRWCKALFLKEIGWSEEGGQIELWEKSVFSYIIVTNWSVAKNFGCLLQVRFAQLL